MEVAASIRIARALQGFIVCRAVALTMETAMAPLPLRGAVGIRYGRTQVVNHAKDQVEVVEMLRLISTTNGGRKEVWTLSPLVSDKVCGGPLAAAINDFQGHWYKKGRFVDGVVDPGGTTYKMMYSLATKFQPFPDQPDGSDGPATPPPGVAPTPADFANVAFDPPLYVGVGLKLSLADPLLFGMVVRALNSAGIHIPHGCDLILASMHQIKGLQLNRVRLMSGVLLGVTPRRGSGGPQITLEKAVAIAKTNGAHPQIIKLLERMAALENNSASSIALSIGITGVMAKGFNNTGQMHGHRSTAGDETAFNVALVGNISTFAKWLLKGVEAVNLATQGWSIIDAGRKLASDKTKAIAMVDIPGLSFGVDIGITKGTADWYAIDLAALW